jgi:predicted RNA polymerase sigma factor
LQAPGTYTLQAAIAACHARATQPQDTDWRAIVALYDTLLQLAPSPVVQLNRAVALSMAPPPQGGPAVALPLMQVLLDQPAMAGYPWLHSVHGDLLHRLGQHAGAARAFDRAAAHSGNAADRAVLQARAAQARAADTHAATPNAAS